MKEKVRLAWQGACVWGRIGLVLAGLCLLTAAGEFWLAPASSFWAFMVAVPHVVYLVPFALLWLLCAWKRDRLSLLVLSLAIPGVALWAGFNVPQRLLDLSALTRALAPTTLAHSPYAQADSGPGPHKITIQPAFNVQNKNASNKSYEGNSKDSLRFVTLNACRFKFGAEHVSQILESSKADIIVLQEVPRENINDNFYPGKQSDWNIACTWQLAILSRYPITSGFRYNLTDPLISGRPVMVVTIETPLGPVTVMDAHWNVIFHPYWLQCGLERGLMQIPFWVDNAALIRQNQATTSLRIMEALGNNVLLFGDLNGNNDDPAVRRLLQGRQEVFAQAGWGFGFSYGLPWPFLRLDHGIFPSDWTIEQVKILPAGASDHRPLQVDARPPQ